LFGEGTVFHFDREVSEVNYEVTVDIPARDQALEAQPPIRIFVGSEKKTMVAERVLIHTIAKHTKHNVQVISMREDTGWHKPDDLRMGTGFSLFRWMIPERCGFEGKAIYQDADQVVHADIAELWNMDHTSPGPAEVWCAFEHDKYNRKVPGMQSSVMLIDCARASYWKPEELWGWMRRGKVRYGDFMHMVGWGRWPDGDASRGPYRQNEISKYWNHFNACEPGKTKLTHYTTEHQQPWYTPGNPARKTWEALLVEAIEAGAVPRDEFAEALARFGKPDKGDRRRTFGIHPHYRRHLGLFEAVRA
jgi:hypothetical protein